jgi:competence protein ComEC
MSEPLLLPLVAILCGVLLGHALGFSRWEAAWPLAAFVFLGILSGRVNPAGRELRRSCAALALLFAGVLAEAWHRPGPRPEIDAGARETVLLAGCVVEPSVLAASREQFTLELGPGARARVTLGLDTLGIEPDNPPQRLDYGQRVEIEARVRTPRNFNNPGSFDYAGYLARQQIFWTATMARGSPARVLPGRCGSRFTAAIFAIRGAALDRIEEFYPGDDYNAGMMEAVLIGETSKLEKIWTDNFRRTGTFHALVISGAHVAVLAGVLLLLLRLAGVAEIPALAMTATAAWLYALVSGMSPPVARAAGGFTLYLVARFLFRRGRALNLLAAVAIGYILLDPGAVFDASFQLSFLCVAALGALSAPLLAAGPSPLARGLRQIANRDADPHLEPRVAQFRVEVRLLAETVHLWTRAPAGACLAALGWVLRAGFFAYEMAIVSLAIQVGLALPMAVYFHRFSFTGITANLIIVPLLEALVPVGFAAIFTGWRALAVCAGWLLHWAARTADWHARWEPAWRVANPPPWMAGAFAAALILFAVALRHRRWQWPGGMAVAALFGVLLWQPWPAQITPRALELTAIDVGQGDSLLVVFPEGRRMVIDGGGVLQFGRAGAPPRRRSNLDTGEDVVSPYLWSRGIQRIDILVATHAHEDHTGGLLAILENFHPRELWVGANPPTALLRRAAERNIPVTQKHASAPFDYGGANIEVLSPPEGYAAAKPGNNDSLALRIVYGANSFLLTGDLEAVMERRLLSDGRVAHADVLKVGHHGSKTSTSPDFLEAVSPSVAVISAGFENSFGHPHRDVVARLGAGHAAILRTDRDGLVTVRSDGRKLSFDSSLGRADGRADIYNWALSFGSN